MRFGETDAQAVVYHANYLLYAEVGRVNYLREMGVDRKAHLAERGVDFAVGEARVRYHAPLRFDEEFDIRVRVAEIRHSSWVFAYRIDSADGRHCATVSTIQVLFDRTSKRAVRLTPDIREHLERELALAHTVDKGVDNHVTERAGSPEMWTTGGC